MRNGFIACVAVVVLAACGPKPAAPKPPLTERQHDSVIGASSLPGAAGVRGALRAQDSATARNARYDSVTRGP